MTTETYSKSSAEAMASYMRTSKRLQRIRWHGYPEIIIYDEAFQHREDMLCCFLPAIQESTSLKELHIDFRLVGGPSNLALENMLSHTQSLRSLRLNSSWEDIAVAAARSGLKNNTTLRELTLEVSRPPISHILTSLRDHPLLQRLCLRGYEMDLTGLETLLLSDTSKITELEIHRSYGDPPPIMGLTPVLYALARRPALTKLGLRNCLFGTGSDEARLLRMALCNIPSLQSLVLADSTLGSAELAELAPALYDNTSIKELVLSNNWLSCMDSAVILRDILRSNKTMTILDLSENRFGWTAGTVDCIADGLGSNSTLLKLDLSRCALRDEDVSTLARNLGSRNTTLHKLRLAGNAITSTGFDVLLETTEQNSHHITDLDLRSNPIGNEGARLLVSALERNTSLLHLDLRACDGFSEWTFLALAESLPEIKLLQRVDFDWCTGLASAMPLLLAGLRKNTSLFRFHVANCAHYVVPPTTEETARSAGDWMQEMERLGNRNRFLSLINAPEERVPPRGVWPRALARVATLSDVIFEVLRSKPSLVLSEDTEVKEAAKDTGVPKKRKRGDN
jgi:hypothetical protein